MLASFLVGTAAGAQTGIQSQLQPPASAIPTQKPAKIPLRPILPSDPTGENATANTFVKDKIPGDNTTTQAGNKNEQPPVLGATGAPAANTGAKVDTNNDGTAADDWRVTKLPPDAAYAAFQRGRFITAFKEAMKRIEANTPDSPSAMTLIAELYQDGQGFRRDHAEAVRWYRLAAERGNREANFAMGRAYLSGNGITKDIARAKQFFQAAASKGSAPALYNLGIMAMEPTEDGKTPDFGSAASLFQKAADAGNLDAVYSLALLYRAGQGVQKNEAKAADLLRQAAEQKHLIAMTEYAIALFNGRGVKKDEAASARYMTRAAWRNSPVAQNRLARMYAAGRGVKRDMVQAMTWHIVARASGVRDQWLDDQLPFLTRTQRKIVHEQVRKFAGK